MQRFTKKCGLSLLQERLFSRKAISSQIMIQKIIILAALVAVMAHAQAETVQIKIAGESGPIALPFNQRLAAWTKIYGVGYHNSNIAATQGWAMAWWFHRVVLAATFTGPP